MNYLMIIRNLNIIIELVYQFKLLFDINFILNYNLKYLITINS